MADDDAARHLLVLDHRAAHLAVHLPDGGGSRLGIVRRGGELRGQPVIAVFEVRQVDIDQPLELPQRLDRLISAAVIDHRHGKLRRQGREDGGQEVRRRDEVDILAALVDQPLKHGAQPGRGERLPEILL